VLQAVGHVGQGLLKRRYHMRLQHTEQGTVSTRGFKYTVQGPQDYSAMGVTMTVQNLWAVLLCPIIHSRILKV